MSEAAILERDQYASRCATDEEKIKELESRLKESRPEKPLKTLTNELKEAQAMVAELKAQNEKKDLEISRLQSARSRDVFLERVRV